jgi:cytidine deaminase
MLKNKLRLIKTAIKASLKSYSPYSNYKVGAAVLTYNNKIFSGTNIENASYGLTLCAERIAVFKAVSEGFKKIIAIAIATKDGAFPCGACRQVLYEFGPDMIVIIVDFNGNIIKETNLKNLLPDAFCI